MRMVTTVRVESDDGQVKEESVNQIAVDTSVEGIDQDAAKEDFVAQARQLLGSIGDTHIPAMYATVLRRLQTPALPDGGTPPAESPAMAQVRGRLQQLRDRKATEAGQGDDPETPETPEQPDEPQTATDELREQV